MNDRARPIGGRLVTLDPADWPADGPVLFAELGRTGSTLWRYTTFGPFTDEGAFVAAMSQQATDGRVPYIVRDRATGAPLGTLSLMDISASHRRAELGSVVFGPELAGRAAGAEAVFLALDHVFRPLGLRRVLWKCDARNAASARAARRYGFRYEGLLRQHMIVRGENRNSLFFGLTDGDWRVVAPAFEAWLDPANFGDDGVQKQRLATLTAEAYAEAGIDPNPVAPAALLR